MRPSVLMVDPDDDRRRALAEQLAERGYEVVPVGSSREGLRFAEGLRPSVVVAVAELPAVADGSLLRHLGAERTRMRPTLVLLGESAAPDDLPDSVRYLEISGLDVEEIRRRIRLVLVSREVGLETSIDLRYLVGDLALVPLLDLVRSLEACLITGRIELPGGSVAFERGQPRAARYQLAKGAKAFCRLARLSAAPFRVYLEASGETTNLVESLDELSLRALEETMLDLPDPRTRLRMVEPHRLPSGELTPHERLLAQVIDRCRTVGEALDGIEATDGLVMQALEKMVSRGALILEPPRSAVKIITDSTCDLPVEVARAHDILVVPLTVHFGRDSFRDGVEIRARDFYRMLEEGEHHPRTEPPAKEIFYEHFHDEIAEHDILAVHISGKLSQTVESSRKAALEGIKSFDHLADARRSSCALEVVDSGSVSMGVGMQALFAARMALRGEKVFAIAQRLRQWQNRFVLLFAVDSLDYLVRGGRIGKARAAVGKLLSIKPILGVVEGEVAAVDRARGGRRVHPRIVQLLGQQVDPKRPLVVCVAHARAPVWADRLRKLLEKSMRIHEIFLADIGPVVGTHAGPGTVGLVAFQPTDEEWQLIAPLDDAPGSPAPPTSPS